MKKIVKYEICTIKQIKERIFEIKLPKDARPKMAFIDAEGKVSLFAEIKHTIPVMETHHVALFATGEDIPSADYIYVGTIDCLGKIYHLYYR
jgi:hypothetical protein